MMTNFEKVSELIRLYNHIDMLLIDTVLATAEDFATLLAHILTNKTEYKYLIHKNIMYIDTYNN